MAAYEPPLDGRSAQDHLLLDFNERTLPVSDTIVEALCSYIRSGSLQKYPAYGDITSRLAEYAGVEADQVMITNGSDQGIDLVVRAAVGVDDVAIIPTPTFAMYQQAAETEKARIISPVYDIEKGYPLEEVLAEINPQTRLIVVPLPNNPCGTAVAEKDIVRLLKAAPDAVVLVDECYFEYSGMSVMRLVAEYQNLVITRTFSKTWGLPSLRFGFLVSQADNIRQLLKIRGPYDINQLAVVAALAALDDPSYTAKYVEEVMSVAKPRFEAWLKAHNIRFWPSTANYVWAFPDKPQVVAEKLQRSGILVRPKRQADGVLGLRITIGDAAQTDRLISVMEAD